MNAEQSPERPHDKDSGDDFDLWELGDASRPTRLSDLVNRVLDRGVVVAGNVTISIAGVDLVYVGINALLTSVSTARRLVRESEEAE